MTGRGPRAAGIVGVGPGADDRGVADPPRQLSGHPAGRGGGGEVAVTVARDRADGAVPARLVIPGCARHEGLLQRPPAGRGMEVAAIGKGETLRPAQRERALADQQDMRRMRSEEHTSELQSQSNLVCRLLLEKKKNIK